MMAQEIPTDDNQPQTLFRRVRNELAIEIVFILLCLLLAVSLEGKVMLAVAMTCLKFAIPHFITGYLVYQADPDKTHGTGLSLLFVAMGLARASLFAFVAVFVAALIMVLIMGPGVPGGPGNAAAIGLGFGFMCAVAFLLLVFPLTLMAATISWNTKTKFEFASGLTKLRRSSEKKKARVKLNVSKSLKLLGLASGLSVSTIFVATMTIPNAHWILLIAAFVMPLIWIPLFLWIVSPRN